MATTPSASTTPAVARADRMQVGDEVILFFGYTQPMKPIVLKYGETFSTREGFWPHRNFMGQPFGARIPGRHRNNADKEFVPAPFVTALRNTPEHWSLSLPHRTQIIVQTDISVIIAKLELRPGKTVAEAGTGSGSLTHSLARAVAPTGKVYTFDFHKERVETAREEFKQHGIGDVVVSDWRDVCTTPTEHNKGQEPPPGYGIGQNTIDALFLDVPCPWDAVQNILSVLREGSGRLCSYSPCIEQTQRFCEALRRTGWFADIHTVESLAREHVPIFTQKHERRRLRDTGLLDVGGGDGAADDGTPQQLQQQQPQTIRGFCPQNTGRGHTAFLTFARRKQREL